MDQYTQLDQVIGEDIQVDGTMETDGIGESNIDYSFIIYDEDSFILEYSLFIYSFMKYYLSSSLQN